MSIILYTYQTQLRNGTVIKRPSTSVKSPYMADVKIDNDIDIDINNNNDNDNDDKLYLAHTPSLGCNGYVDKDKQILLLPKKGTNTKSSFSVEFAFDELSNTYVGTNPYISNQIVYEMIENSKIPYFNDKIFTHMKREKTVLNSRFDIYLEDDQDNKYFVEVKTAPVKDYECNSAIFPKGYRKKKSDPFSPRAIKHVEELTKLSEESDKNKCVLIFMIPRDDIDYFSPCYEDPLYCQKISDAVKSGVKIIAISTRYSSELNSIVLDRFLQVKLKLFYKVNNKINN